MHHPNQDHGYGSGLLLEEDSCHDNRTLPAYATCSLTNPLNARDVTNLLNLRYSTLGKGGEGSRKGCNKSVTIPSQIYSA